MKWIDKSSRIDELDHPLLQQKKISLGILREDLIHPTISGNKYRKLKYNLLQAAQLHKKSLITFGGAYSNHIAATAAAGKLYGFETVGIIRGDELANHTQLNPTLSAAVENGMQLKFIDRESYRKKNEQVYLENLLAEFPQSYIIPEGGTNRLAVQGCEEILNHTTTSYHYICCAVGTGGTISGILNSVEKDQKVLGFPALKNADFLHNEIKKFSLNINYELINAYHFNGYAKISEELINFVKNFYNLTKIPLDLTYTGKMMFGLWDMIQRDCFQPKTKILVIHTGGIQGNKGFKFEFV